MEWPFWVLAAVSACSGVLLLKIATFIWWKPLQIKNCFESQGIRGPPYRLLSGNAADIARMITEAKSTPMPWSHDIVARVIPHIHQWTKTYGEDFIFWFGPNATLYVPHPELIKEILSKKFEHYEKSPPNPLARELIGRGLVALKGEKWAQHKKIIGPAFHLDFLKVGMILNEALRLYPPAVFLARQTYKPMKLGRFSIPAGIGLLLPILAIHHDPSLWGNDAKEFNPSRFSEGIAKAAEYPSAFMPFGIGPRACVGQNFAMLEAKVVLAMILQKFSFVTSPSYAHAPNLVITMQPQHGAHVILHMN